MKSVFELAWQYRVAFGAAICAGLVVSIILGRMIPQALYMLLGGFLAWLIWQLVMWVQQKVWSSPSHLNENLQPIRHSVTHALFTSVSMLLVLFVLFLSWVVLEFSARDVADRQFIVTEGACGIQSNPVAVCGRYESTTEWFVYSSESDSYRLDKPIDWTEAEPYWGLAFLAGLLLVFLAGPIHILVKTRDARRALDDFSWQQQSAQRQNQAARTVRES